MIALVVIVSLLALTSGSLKVFGKGGRTAGFSPLALLEIAAGLGVPTYALTAESPGGALTWLLYLTLLLILLSSLLQFRRARARLRHREETESARLNVYVNHLSRQSGGDPVEEGREG